MIFQKDSVVRFGEPMNVQDFLPKGIYRLSYDNRKEEYFLIQKPNFKLPKKLYGNHSVTTRWVKSYETFGKTGILLTGPAGTGKTVTAIKFCIESGLPVIIIDESHTDGLLDFLSRAELGRCIIFIDEFEKIYNREQQEVFLSILDGQYSSDLVFLLTINYKERVNEFLKNRLGRIKFKQEYTYLTREEAEEIINDLLENKSYKDELIEEIIELGIVTVDILKHMINEINLQELSPKEIVKMLSLYPVDKYYSIYLEVEGQSCLVRERYSVDYSVDFSHTIPKELVEKLNGATRNSVYAPKDEFIQEGKDILVEDSISGVPVIYRFILDEVSPFATVAL